MEHFAKHHRQALNALLGTDFGKTPSDGTFRHLLAQFSVSLDRGICDGVQGLDGSSAQRFPRSDRR